MDWPTAIGVSGSIGVLGVAVVLLVVKMIGLADDRSAAIKAQLEQAANQREAERQRDVAIVDLSKARGERDLANATCIKLHAAVDALIEKNREKIQEDINDAPPDKLLDIARVVLGVPARVPSAADSGDTGSGGGAASPASVPRP